jgi:single-strand DNA-binding protein
MIDALISGKLIKDPVQKIGQSGKPFCNFMLAVPVADGEPILVSGIAFSETAEKIAKLQKGDALSVTGSLKPTEWADRATGELKRGLSVTVSAALSAYDIRKRRGSTEGKTAENAPQTRNDRQRNAPPTQGGYDFDDPIGF